MKILVVGDIMLDHYIYGDVFRVSPEAPIPVVLQKKEVFNLGGCGNVISNLVGLGFDCCVCAAIGCDWGGEKIKELLKGVEHCLVIDDRPTTVKNRIVGNNQQIVRVDNEVDTPIYNEALIKYIKEADVDGVIISDYAKGVVSREIVEACLSKNIVVVDPKPKNASIYKGVSALTPNLSESLEMGGVEVMLDRFDCECILVTKGSEGMSVYHDCECVNLPSRARKVFDVSGAGDTVVSVFTAALIAGFSFVAAASAANIAAGIVVEEHGTTAITKKKIKEAGYNIEL